MSPEALRNERILRKTAVYCRGLLRNRVVCFPKACQIQIKTDVADAVQTQKLRKLPVIQKMLRLIRASDTAVSIVLLKEKGRILPVYRNKCPSLLQGEKLLLSEMRIDKNKPSCPDSLLPDKAGKYRRHRSSGCLTSQRPPGGQISFVKKGQIRTHPLLQKLLLCKAENLRQILIHQLRTALLVLKNISVQIRSCGSRKRILKCKIPHHHLRQSALIVHGKRQHVVIEEPRNRKSCIHSSLVPDKTGRVGFISADQERTDALQNISSPKIRYLCLICLCQNPEQTLREGLSADCKIVQLSNDRFSQYLVLCRKIKGLQLHISQLIPEVRGFLHQLIIFQIQKRRTAARFIILTEHARRFLRPPHPLRVGIQKKPRNPEILRIPSLLLCKLPHGVVNGTEGRPLPCGLTLCTKDREIQPVCIRQIVLQIELDRGKRRKLLVRSG